MQSQFERVMSDVSATLDIDEKMLYKMIQERVVEINTDFKDDCYFYDNVASDLVVKVFTELLRSLHLEFKGKKKRVKLIDVYEALLITFIRNRVNDPEASLSWKDTLQYLEDMV